MNSSPAKPARIFRFGPFELSEREGELRKGGIRIKLQDQPARVLLELLSNAGQIVTREELQQRLWPADTFVDFDTGLNSAIRKLRQGLGDDAESPRYIETIAKRGYRFIAPLRPEEPSTAELKPLPPASSATAAEKPSLPSNARRRLQVIFIAATAAAVVLGALAAAFLWHNVPRTTSEQRMTSNPEEAPVIGGMLSPDGKYLAYADPSGVYLRVVATGETHPLTTPPGGGWIPTSWFPDCAHLLLSTRRVIGEVESLAGPPKGSIWKASILGGAPQLLIDNAYAGSVAPDAKRIAFIRDNGYEGRQLWLAQVDHVPVTESMLSGPSDHVVSNPVWSPGGRRLAYLRAYQKAPESWGLESIDVQSHTVTVLRTGTRFGRAVWWANDGRLFYGWQPENASSRNTFAVLAVAVDERTGEPIGKEKRVTEGLGDPEMITSTADTHHLALLRRNEAMQAYVAEFTPAGTLSPLRRITLDENQNIVSAWSGDSQSILFYSNRNGSFNLYRQRIDQSIPELLVEGRRVHNVRMASSGTDYVYVDDGDPDEKHPSSVMKLAIGGGTPRELLSYPNIHDIQCARGVSRLCLIGAISQSGLQVLSFDPDTGSTQPMRIPGDPYIVEWSLSPDGATLAMLVPGPKLAFLDIAHKSVREVKVNGWERLIALDWTPDNQAVLMSARAPDGNNLVLRIERDGASRAVFSGGRVPRVAWAVPSPDGHRVAVGAVSGENNVWMVNDP